jgi:lipopolysaccharide export system protein LptA
MSVWKRSCYVALLLVLLAAPSPGRALDLGEGPVLLVADRVEYDTKENVVSAHGNVEVVRGGRIRGR